MRSEMMLESIPRLHRITWTRVAAFVTRCSTALKACGQCVLKEKREKKGALGSSSQTMLDGLWYLKKTYGSDA